MTDFTFTEDEQRLIDEVREHAGDAAVRLPEGNHTHPYCLRSLLELAAEWSVQWWSEDDPSSPSELYLVYPDTLTFEQGLNVAGWIDVVFGPNDAQVVDTSDGQVTYRLMFDNPDEIDEGDRVREVLPIDSTATAREGKALLVEREDEDEPRTLRVNVRWDGDEHSQWLPYEDVTKIHADGA